MWKLQALLLLSRCCVIMVLAQHWHWDLRKFEVLLTLPGHAHSLNFSQKGLLVCGTGSFIKDLNDPFGTRPYEDVLGIGHSMGWSDILIPGLGEPRKKTEGRNKPSRKILQEPRGLSWSNKLRRKKCPERIRVSEEVCLPKSLERFASKKVAS